MSNPAPYVPVLPLQAVWKSVLSQDIITTATIPVDSNTPAPVGVFRSERNGSEYPEALAIVNTGRGRQLCHVARDSGSDGGWRAEPLFSGQLAEQVAAGVAYAGSSAAQVCGVFLHDGKLSSTALADDGSTWLSPASIEGGAVDKLRVAYSPNGRVVFYGANTGGNLITVYQAGAKEPFVSSVCDTQGALSSGDFVLCMTDEEPWTILANLGGKAHVISGVLGGAKAATSGRAPGFDQPLKQVSLGYWSAAQNTLVFLLIGEDNQLHAWSQGQTSAAQSQSIPNGKVAQATGHVSDDGSLHVYAVDSNQQLWVLHQAPKNPWNNNGSPNWAPIMALDQGVARIASDMNPAAEPALFGLAAGDFSLRLHALDDTSRLWKSHKVLQKSAKAYEVTRFRTEVSVIDANGQPLPSRPVKLKVKEGSSAVDVWAAGRVHTIDDQSIELKTDATGKLTLAILTTEGLTCPHLVMTGDGLGTAIEIQPAGETHSYLAGRGTLHPTHPSGELPVFDESGTTLSKATVNGRALAPGASNPELAATAAKAIRVAAAVGAGKAGPEVYGFAGSLQQHAPSFQVFHSAEQLHAHRTKLGYVRLEDVQGGADWKSFFGDIFEGIKNGVIKVLHFAVDAARKIVDLTLKIAGWTADVLGLPFDGIEKAADFMAGVFNAVDAGIDKVVDWLKALFDFGSIWRTKMALQEGILRIPGYVTGLARSGQKAADGWFIERRADVDVMFDQMKAKYQGQTFEQQPNWQQPGGTPGTTPIVGGASASDFTSNPHHNWLQDKVSSYSPEYTVPQNDSQKGPWDAFAVHVGKAGNEFEAALGEFSKAVSELIKNPASFGSVGIPSLIDMLRHLLHALLELCDAGAAAIAGIAESAMQALDALLNTELQLGFVNTLWEWVASAAGYANDGKLTMAALISLFAAFPCTIIYKLIVGVKEEPFPQGRFPAAVHSGMLGISMPKPCRVIACILTMVSVVPAIISDVLGDAAPWWMTVIGIGFSAAVWILNNGYPELSGIQWAGLSAVAANMLWLLPAVYFIIETENAVLLDKIKAAKGTISGVLTTAYGVASLVFGIVQDVTTTLPAGKGIANILSPLPSVFAFLDLESIRANPAIAPFAIGAKIVFDFVGKVGGGAELLVTELKAPAVATA